MRLGRDLGGAPGPAPTGCLAVDVDAVVAADCTGAAGGLGGGGGGFAFSPASPSWPRPWPRTQRQQKVLSALNTAVSWLAKHTASPMASALIKDMRSSLAIAHMAPPRSGCSAEKGGWRTVLVGRAALPASIPLFPTLTVLLDVVIPLRLHGHGVGPLDTAEVEL